MYRHLKFLARNVIFPSLVATGLHRTIWSDKNKVLFLMYHGVNADGDTSINGRHISAKRFEQHLQYFTRHFEVLTLAEAFNSIDKPKNNKPRVCLTFDDGFENNLQYAAPLLKKYSIPATFYISSVCATEEADILWPDVVDLILNNHDQVEVNGLKFERNNGFFSADSNSSIQDYIKSQDRNERDAIISELSDKYGLANLKSTVNPERWKLMTNSQLQELSRFKEVEIGSHCHYHYNLANLSEENSKDELRKSKQLLEESIQKEVTSVAFPDGSYNKRVKEQSLEAGYSKLCAVTYKLDDDHSDKSIVKRSAVSSTTNYYSNVVHFHKHFAKDGN